MWQIPVRGTPTAVALRKLFKTSVAVFLCAVDSRWWLCSMATLLQQNPDIWRCCCSDSRGWPQLSGFSKEADILVLHVPQKRNRESASIHVNNMEMGFDGGLFYRIN